MIQTIDILKRIRKILVAICVLIMKNTHGEKSMVDLKTSGLIDDEQWKGMSLTGIHFLEAPETFLILYFTPVVLFENCYARAEDSDEPVKLPGTARAPMLIYMLRLELTMAWQGGLHHADASPLQCVNEFNFFCRPMALSGCGCASSFPAGLLETLVMVNIGSKVSLSRTLK